LVSMAQRTRVLLLIPHLGGGGAERVTESLARNLSQERFEIHLGLVTQETSDEGSLPSWVTVHALGERRVRNAAVSLLRLVRTIKPDVILSSMAHLNFLVLLLRPFVGGRTAVLVRQNGTVSAALASRALPAYTRLAYRLLYRRADHVICQTEAMAADLAQLTGVPQEKLAVLPNPVDLGEIRTTAKEMPEHKEAPEHLPGPGPHLLGVGRLAREKGFDLLINAIASVRRQFPDADLTLVGAGREEHSLRELTAELGLKHAVRFAGHMDRPAKLFAGASVFVLSSRHEGMPNALLEAAAAGLPLVAMPASGGVTDLLRNQPGVWLSHNISADALATSLLSALPALRPGERFRHAFVDQFSLQCAIPAYQALIDKALQEREP